MNNEEKILSMLETLVSEQQKTNQRLDKLEQGQADLKQEINHLSIMTENIQHNVELLAEGHTAVIEKLDSLPDFSETKAEIEVLEKAVAKHSDKFSNLKEAL